MDEPTTKPFITMKGTKDGIIRLWTDRFGEIYKVEIRKNSLSGYFNTDEFVDRVEIKHG